MKNKYQEALDVVKKQSFESYEQYCDKYGVKPVGVLQKLVDKEKPIIPTIHTLERPDGKGGKEFWQNTYWCPICENQKKQMKSYRYDMGEVEKGQTYCKDCGQKLDWSDNND